MKNSFLITSFLFCFILKGAVAVPIIDKTCIKKSVDPCVTSNSINRNLPLNAFTPTPSTDYAIQIFTTGSTISDLVVYGQEIKWYAAIYGGTPILSDAMLVNDTTYYATQTIAGVESSRRMPVHVYELCYPQQFLNSGETLADLNNNLNNPTNINWYADVNGTTPLNNSDVLTSGTYYVEQFVSPSVETITLGVDIPQGIALDVQGDILVIDGRLDEIKRLDPDGSNIVTESIVFSNPQSISVSQRGDILISDTVSPFLRIKIPNTSNYVDMPSSLGSAFEAAFDGLGNIFTTEDSQNGSVNFIDRFQNRNIIATNVGFSKGIEVDLDGSIVFANESAVLRMDSDGGNLTTLRSTGFTSLNGLAININGDIIVADTGDNSIKIMDSDGTNLRTLATGFTRPKSLVIDEKGSILIADTNDNSIKKIIPESVSNRVPVFVNMITQPPVIDQPIQVFTAGDLVSDLIATGQNLKWYSSLDDGRTALDPNTVLINGTQYYGTQTISNAESTKPVSVLAYIISPKRQQHLDGSTVADLISTPRSGATNSWFGNHFSPSPLVSSTVLNTGDYFIEQTVGAFTQNIAIGSNTPQGIALDAQENIIFTDPASNSVKKINRNGNIITILATGFNQPSDLVIDPFGNIIIADTGNNVIKRINKSDGSVSTLGTGFNAPSGVALNFQGNIIVSDTGNNSIKLMNPIGTTIDVISNTMNEPQGIAVDYLGNIYVADKGSNTIKRMDFTGSNVVNVGLGFVDPTDVLLDFQGNIIVSDNGNNAIKRMDVNGNNIQTISSGLMSNTFIEQDSQGDLIIVETGNNTTNKFHLSKMSNRALVEVETVDVIPIPTTTRPVQVFTTGSKISGLSALGQNILWYDTPASGISLLPTTPLVSSNRYYASQTIGGLESDRRLKIIAQEISAPQQILSAGNTISSLITTPDAVGNAVWYDNPSGGVALTGGFVLQSGTYYVEQEISVQTTEIGPVFNTPYACVVEPTGKIIVADTRNNVIKRMDADGNNVVTIATGFNNPSGIALDDQGKILIADTDNNTIKRMNADGTNIETLGSGFSRPFGIALDGDDIIVADGGNNLIKRMDSNGNNVQIVGVGFSLPNGVAVDSQRNIWVADSFSNSIKRMDASGNTVTTIATGFDFPMGIAIGADGDIYIADTRNDAIKRMSPDGSNIITLVSGLDFPTKVELGLNNSLVIADTFNNRIKEILLPSISNRVEVQVDVIAPPPAMQFNNQIFTTGSLVSDLMSTGVDIKWYDSPTGGMPLDPTTSLIDGSTYYASQTISGIESVVRAAVNVTGISTPVQEIVVASIDELVTTPRALAAVKWYSSENSTTPLTATDVLTSGIYFVEQETPQYIDLLGTGFTGPFDITTDSSGNIIIADTFSDSIKKMNADGSNLVTLVTGLNRPSGVAIESNGNIVFTDTNSNSVKRIHADGSNLTTIATGFNQPHGIAIDINGNILVADTNNRVLKRINVKEGNSITTLGSGFNFFYGVNVDSQGNILVADTFNNAVKRMDPDGTNIVTLGSGFSRPYKALEDSNGNILVADSFNDSIKLMDTNGGNIVVLESSLRTPLDVELDAFGNLLIVEILRDSISKLNLPVVSNRVAVQVNYTSSFVFENGAWSPNAPNSMSNVSTSTDNFIVNESVALPVGNYAFNDLVINNSSALVTLEPGATLNVYGDIDIIQGTLDTRNGTLIFNGQRDQSTSSRRLNIIAGDVILNDAQINLNEANQDGIVINGVLSATSGNASTINILQTTDNPMLTFADNGVTRGSINPINLNIAGNVTVEEYFESRRAFRFLSSPLEMSASIRATWMENGVNNPGKGILITGTGGMANGFDQSTSNNPSLFTYDNVNRSWKSINDVNNELPQAGKPYRVFVRGDRSQSLTQVTTPNPSITTISHTGDLLFMDKTTLPNDLPSESPATGAPNYVLAGNPFVYDISIASAFVDVDFNAVRDNIYYVWDPKGGNGRGVYRNYSNIAGNESLSGTIINSDYIPGVLKIGQAAFFERSDQSIENNFTIKQSLIAAAAAPSSSSVNNTPIPAIDIELYETSSLHTGNGNSLDALIIYMDDQFDNGYITPDAIKFSNIDETLSRVHLSGYRLGVEVREFPVHGELLPLELSNHRNNDYTFKIAATQLLTIDAYLYDKFTNESTLLSADLETLYHFIVDRSSAQSSAVNRFEIQFSNQTLGIDEDAAFAKAVNIYPNPISEGVLSINVSVDMQGTTISLFSTQGQLIKKIETDKALNTIDVSNLKAGLYMIQIKNKDKELTRKVVIK